MARKESIVSASAEEIAAHGWEKTVIIGLPPGKDAIKLRIDRDVLDWFRQSGKGYQTRMNNVLRAFVKTRGVTGR